MFVKSLLLQNLALPLHHQSRDANYPLLRAAVVKCFFWRVSPSTGKGQQQPAPSWTPTTHAPSLAEQEPEVQNQDQAPQELQPEQLTHR